MSKSVALLLVLVFLLASCLIGTKLSLAASAVENTWETKALIPQTEGIGGAVAVNGRIYVIGSLFTYEYNPATDNWVEKTPMPTPRTNFEVAAYQNKIYTIGGSSGWTQETGTIYSDANEVYDPSTDTWETKESMPVNRSGIVASVVKGKIHLIGPDSHDVYEVDTDSWSTKEPMPLPTYRLGSTVVDDKIYVMGWNQTQIYDQISDTWTLGASPPNLVGSSGICATTGVIAPKRIYVIGGSVNGLEAIWSGNTQVYDPVSDSWTLGADMLTACYGVNAVVVNDQIYAIGGIQGMYSSRLNTNQQYTPIGYGTIPPEVVVVSPENTTYTSSSVSLVFTVNKPAVWLGYSLDGQETVTINGNTTISGLTNGVHNVTVYARDEFGNTGVSETVSFSVAEPFPTTLVIAPIASVVVVGVGLLVYFRKRRK